MNKKKKNKREPCQFWFGSLWFMHIKNRVQYREFSVILFSCLVFVTSFYYLFQQNFDPTSDQREKNISSFVDQKNGDSSSSEVISPLPIRLRIAKINVDAVIEFVGLTPLGAMGAPKGGKNVGWYSAGPHPGDIGSAVIDGHFGRWKNGEGSVFDNLDKLEKGDTIYVEDDKGTFISFIVRESRTYESNADASDVFSSDDEGSHLNLITCEGIWNKDSKSYSGRRVVFADKE